MIIIVTALHPEAKPFIRHFGLKKDSTSPKVPIYRNERICVVVSGFGSIRSAIATSTILSKFKEHQNMTLFNIGISGCRDYMVPIGTPFLVNQIKDHDREKQFHPDILFKHPLEEADLESFNYPISREKGSILTTLLVDMEAAGCFEAATVFLPVHQVQCIKIVSDHLNIFECTKESISELIHKNMHLIEETINTCHELYQCPNEDFSFNEEQGLQTIVQSLKLTVSQTHELRSSAKFFKLRTGKSLKFPHDLVSNEVLSKREGKYEFERVKQYLQNP